MSDSGLTRVLNFCF